MKKRNVIIIIVILIIVTILLLVLFNINKGKDNLYEVNYTENTEKKEIELLSEDEAKKIISSSYRNALKLYSFGFSLNEIEGSQKIGLSDFDTKMKSLFSAKGIEQFNNYYKGYIINEDNNKYIINNSNIREEYEYSSIIQNLQIDYNTIKCNIKSTYEYNSNETKKNEEFVLVRENGNWYVDSMIRPY